MSRAGAFTGSVIALVLLASGGASGLNAEPAAIDVEGAWKRLARGDFATALPALQRLAEDGDVRAQDTLAGLHLQGIGTLRDVPAAMGWYCRVAHQPLGGAAVMHAVWFLAEYFRTGGGVPGPAYNAGRPEYENPLRAYFWFSVMAGQEDLYETLDDASVILGKIGANAVAGVLFTEEKTAIDEALKEWRPARPVDSADACLALPEGLPGY